MNAAPLGWTDLEAIWTFANEHSIGFWAGVSGFGFIFTLLLALRFVYWLPKSSAWPAVLVRLVGGLMLVPLAFGAAFIALDGLRVWWASRFVAAQYSPAVHKMFVDIFSGLLDGAGVGGVNGIAVLFLITRYVIPRFSQFLETGTRKASHDRMTDARTVAAILPKSQNYDPRRNFESCLKHGELFLGLNRESDPVSIPLAVANQTHIQLVGPTRTGKGLVAQNLLAQSVLRRQAVVVMDPKIGGDKWLPSVLIAECQKAGLPFRFIDLCAATPQFNLLKGCTQREVRQLLITGLRLGRKGEAADFYRAAERAHAKRVTNGDKDRTWSLPELADALREAAGDDEARLRGLLEVVDELADIAAIQTGDGIELGDVLTRGGVLYIAGSDSDEDIRMLQPMILQRLVQLIRNRERDSGLQVTMFLDEVKYLLSTAVLNSLGLIADRNCNLILAHQSLKELVCIDADRQTTEGIVNTNCAIRFCYRQTEPETVAWIESQTGKILVNAESREVERNVALAQVQQEAQRVQQVQRATIDANMINQLPPGCAVLIGAGVAQFVFSCPLKVERVTPTPVQARKVARIEASSLLMPDDQGGDDEPPGLL